LYEDFEGQLLATKIISRIKFDMMNKILLLILVLLGSYSLHVQSQYTVSGRVTDTESGEPLSFVTIVEKGTTNGTTTDLQGKYSLTVSDENAVLKFTYVGFLDEEIPVAGKNEIDVVLVPDLQQLDELVVIGYGSTKKSDLTGAISSVSSDDIENIPSMSIDQALQGKAAGVQVVSNTGAPGSSITVRIRGVSTLNSGKEPLYVVDGFIMGDNGFGKEGSTTTDNKFGIGFLDPNEIESVEILKDASAAAIYGARGANGVVLITTKKGKAGKAKINFDMYRGVQGYATSYDLMKADQFRQYNNEYRSSFGLPLYPAFEPGNELTHETDWLSEVTNQNAVLESYKLSASGGTEAATYLFSGSYFNQEGMIKGSAFDKFSIRLNSDQKLTDKIKTGQNIIVTRSYRDRIIEGTSNSNNSGILSNALIADPSAPVYDTTSNQLLNPSEPNWTYLNRSNSGNPVGIYQRNSYTYESYRYFGNAYLDINFTPALVFHSNFGMDINDGNMQSFFPRFFISPEQSNDNNQYEYREEQWINWDFENTLTYSKGFGNHFLSVMGGFTAQKETFQDVRLSFKQFPYNESFMRYPNVPSVNEIVSGIQSDPMAYSIMSGLSRVSYNYGEKYFITATYRIDGSSKFGPEKRWGKFPSFSLAYKISEEEFMHNISSLSFMKFRGGWGQLGNQSILPYQYTTTIFDEGNNYSFGTDETLYLGFLPNGVSNEAVQWETTTQTNVGLDMGWFSNKLNISLDYFSKKTTDLLMNTPHPLFSGVHSLRFVGQGRPTGFGNVAALENRGVEGLVSYKIRMGDISINLSANLAYLQNKVLELTEGNYINSNGSNVFNTNLSRTEVDGNIAAFYGYVVDGIFQDYDEIADHAYQGVIDPYTFDRSLEPTPNKFVAPGDFKFRDLNADTVINNDDRTYLGNPLPDFTFGFNVNLTYKGFDLNANFYGMQGNEIVNTTKYYLLGSTTSNNKLVDAADHWSESNKDSENPRIGIDKNDNMRFSDYFVEDGSFLRLKTLTLGYTLPEKIVSTVKMSSLRVYFTAQNLFTFTNYSGLEPEVGSSIGWSAHPLDIGVDNTTYPHPRVFMFGLNASF